METVIFGLFTVFVLCIVCVLYGVVKAQLKETRQGLQEGEKIDTIIHNNSDISDDEWFGWLQDRRDK